MLAFGNLKSVLTFKEESVCLFVPGPVLEFHVACVVNLFKGGELHFLCFFLLPIYIENTGK